MIGNLYAVGTHDLGVFLITSDEGHILINTALSESTPLIRRNIESLGFRMDDIRILLSMQAHWDHTAALAEIKRTTGARMWATAGDAPVLEGRRLQRPALRGARVVRAGRGGPHSRRRGSDRAGGHEAHSDRVALATRPAVAATR